MKRLQKTFSRDLQNTLSLLGQSELGSPFTAHQQFTHHNSIKKSPIQIITATQTQNSSKTKPKAKTKMKTKQNSSKLSSKRKTPIKKHQKKSSDQMSLNSILENPISSSDPNIKIMFTLFHLERTYRMKKVEKLFYFWYKKLTRKLLKIRLDQQRSQSMIQSSSIIHISTPTTDQKTQTELFSDSDSDILNFSNNDVQDFPNIVDDLSNTQLIHKVMTGSSIYNNDIDEEDGNDLFSLQTKKKQKNYEDHDKSLIENSFISWKSEKLSNEVISRTCELASTIIEKSITYEDPRNSCENLENYLHKQNQIKKKYNDERNSNDNYIDLNFTPLSGSNDSLSEDEYNSTTQFDEDFMPYQRQSSLNESKTISNLYQQQSLNRNENIFIFNGDHSKGSTSYFNSAIEPQISGKERNRPPPVDINAKILSIPKLPDSKSPENLVKTKPESELKRYLRNIITEEFFETVKSAQKRNDISLPLIVIPPNVQKPWKFTNEYCDLIIDVINEFTQITDLTNYTTEVFLDYLSDFFEKSHSQRNKTIFSELESLYQKKFNEFLLSYSIDLADSMLQNQLDSILNI